MSYSPEHKQRTRQRIVDSARQLFRRRGMNGVGIDEIMADAALTRGGFYAHFPSKDALFMESLAGGEISGDGTGDLVDIIDTYLSDGHRDHPEIGCPLPSLSADAARATPEIRSRFTKVVKGLVAMVMRGAGRSGGDASKYAAYATVAQLVGAVVLARAVNDPRISDDILAACRKRILSAAHAP